MLRVPVVVQLRGREVEGSMVFFEEHPAKPYAGAKIMSSQPNLLQDFATGLNTTQFRCAPHATQERCGCCLACARCRVVVQVDCMGLFMQYSIKMPKAYHNWVENSGACL